MLEATQFENKTNQLEKVDLNSLRENHKDFTQKKKKRLILKSEQRFLTVDLIIYAYGTHMDMERAKT